MSNILIVESKNDEAFMRTLIDHMNLANIEVDKPICHIDEYDCMNGLNLNKVILRLEALKNSLPKKQIDSVGIILDHDGKRKKRIEIIDNAVENVFSANKKIEKTGEFIEISSRIGSYRFDLKLSCFLVNVDERGELETLLKTIKAKPSHYADCLEKWRLCLEDNFDAVTDEEKQKLLSNKEFDKFWVNNYIRFDTCSKKEKKQAFRKCSISQFEYILKTKKDIFNFDHPALNDLKSYLSSFASI